MWINGDTSMRNGGDADHTDEHRVFQQWVGSVRDGNWDARDEVVDRRGKASVTFALPTEFLMNRSRRKAGRIPYRMVSSARDDRGGLPAGKRYLIGLWLTDRWIQTTHQRRSSDPANGVQKRGDTVAASPQHTWTGVDRAGHPGKYEAVPPRWRGPAARLMPCRRVSVMTAA
jgi:hypothetical protein